MKKYIVLLFFVVFLICNSNSQINQAFVGFKDTAQASVTIDFKFVNNLIVIPLQINNSDTLWFILDSGIRPTLLTSFTNTMEFNVADSTTIRGLGEGDDLKVWYTFDNVIEMKDIKFTKQSVFVLAKDKFDLPQKMGVPINGIIGYTIFDNFVVEIDYEKKKMTLFNPKKFVYKRKYKKWVKIPLTLYAGKPYSKIKVQLNKDTLINANVLIDIGASDALWLFPGSHDSIVLDTTKQVFYLGQGLNGDIFGQQGRVDKVIIQNKYSLENVTVSYPEPRGLDVPDNYDIEGRNGSIGSEIMRRFDVIFDYSNNLLMIRKNAEYKGDFNVDYSGMEIIAPFVSLHYYEIFYVQQDSPADKAGLKAGDQIIKINNNTTSRFSLNEILMLMKRKEGKKLKIEVDRNGEIIKTVLILENYRH
ncbi:MAG: PDZ domain-containing protein [Bacteroidales bacterium]|nr:PDZ domain-containing protein [Bacteroidales bacterium]